MKRGRKNGGGAYQSAQKKRKTYHQKNFKAGYDRRSGYYGRYAPSGAELKFHDVDVNDVSIAQNGTILNSGSVNLIAQGVTESTRVGRKCTIRKILWRYNMILNASGAINTSETVRMILYQDKQCNGAAATVTDILESDNYQSFRNLANSGRFKILMDRVYSLQHTAGAGDGTANDAAPLDVNDQFYQDCNIPLEFNSTTGAITEIRSNNLGVLILGRTGLVSQMDSKMRLRFSDG